jgi:hypothetical protein
MSMEQEPLKPNPRQDHAYAIVRYETSRDENVPPELRITVKKVVFDGTVAEAEVRRLNDLNRDKGCFYFSQVTRVERVPPMEAAPAVMELAGHPR